MVEPQHYRKLFNQQLDEIDRRVVRLFGLVTEAVAGATVALLTGDREAARATSEQESVVDELEHDLEQLAQRELLRQSPVARDMRYLLSVVRVVPELERSGDLADHIAQRALGGLTPRLTPPVRGILEEMGAACVEMWHAATDAWAERDAAAAERIDIRDDRIDSLHDELVRELGRGDLVLADAMQVILLGRFYERLGDHSVHIAERIVYLAGT